ncbi:hypothetical protein FRC09_002289 [Ceratobasidium sp. 395]|nr:hypothetical protein FRC09_002289 [Ceratobasidium sp. 395]
MASTDATNLPFLPRLLEGHLDSLKPSPCTSEAPHTPSIEVTAADDRVEVCAVQITEFHSKGESAVSVAPISSEEIEQLYELLSRKGLKIRFDWDSETSTAYVRMPTLLHSAPLATWVANNTQLAQNFILRAMEAAKSSHKPVLFHSSDASILLSNGTKLSPDAAWAVHYKGDKNIPAKFPVRVVFECSLTQQFSDVLDKTWKFLWATKVPYLVHKVVIFDFNKDETPTGKNVLYRLTIQSWVRDAGDNIEAEYPLDNCPLVVEQDSPAPADRKEVGRKEESTLLERKPASSEGERASAQKEPAPSERPDDRKAASLSDSWRSDEKTKVDEWPQYHSPRGEKLRIRRREKQVMVVYDEALDTQPGGLALRLDAYDLLRACGSQPSNPIPNKHRMLRVPVEPLQELVHLMVLGQREEERLLSGVDLPQPSAPPAPQQPQAVAHGEKRVRFPSYSEFEEDEGHGGEPKEDEEQPSKRHKPDLSPA